MVTIDNLIGLGSKGVSTQLLCIHVDEKVIAGYREDIGAFELERQGAVMSQVYRKQLWKQTVSKLIQVREIMQCCCCFCCGVISGLSVILVYPST